ncbi:MULTISPECIES: hypothetical protein [Glycomyces]|uniref:Uncharacterized protein n=2 Tax=Glycomyces TaxID=58113 RepID=A0A9X3T7B3_9ACTN|nr:hypothetical protein [Glycomyces lechevalierae]MDA1384028.1 hypothetical protein [Glycomyces lechevalierae]MDR7340977.1 hypothetical protein [Glycomyces lechevalierae]
MASTTALHARYPLPDWRIDSKFKRDLTLAIAAAIAAETDRWPPATPAEHARRVTEAARAAVEPRLTWLDEGATDGFSYPGDDLVAYIAQLALTRPGEVLTPDHYRDLLRAYRHHLESEARRFEG